MRNVKVTPPYTLKYHNWPLDGHPTKCWKALEKLSKYKFICPVEMENYIEAYAHFWEYSLSSLDQHIKRGHRDLDFISGIGWENIPGFKREDRFPFYDKRQCIKCKSNPTDHRKCQICSGAIVEGIKKCLASKEDVSLFKDLNSRIFSKRICQTPEKCQEIWEFYIISQRSKHDKYPCNAIYDDEIIKERGLFITTKYLEMLLDKKRRQRYERRKKRRDEAIRGIEKDGENIRWPEECSL